MFNVFGYGNYNGLTGYYGTVIILCFIFLGVAAPVISPYNPTDYAGLPLESPSREHWLGTNDLGQDIFSELIWGTRVSVFIGLMVGSVSTMIATGVALVSGVYGGWLDRLLMRLVDFFLAVPRLPAIILLAVYLGSSLSTMIIVLALFSWAKGARVIRAQVLTTRQQPHVEAALLFGASRGYLMGYHILPELIPLTTFKFIRAARYAIITEAGLAFLGLGDPTIKSWGLMFHYGQAYPGIYYTQVWLWWLLPPALCLMILLLGFLLIGYSLEETANPQGVRSA